MRTDDEKQRLDQRNLIETVIDCLKHKYHLRHTRHRSMVAALRPDGINAPKSKSVLRSYYFCDSAIFALTAVFNATKSEQRV